jgi:folate-binding protein YgfZ
MSTEANDSGSLNTGGLGTLAFRGPDAAKFLQGQLSADTEKLAPGGSTLAGLHNPQGRVIALLDLTRTSPEEFLASLPLELLDPVAQRLRKYLLRSKARIEETAETPRVDVLPDLAAIRAGRPQVYRATSENFVAQMLNLDLLGAIAFDKGCYTGQEVIARAHYRGKVKRRMQRWLNARGTELRPGDAAHGPDGRALTVVRVAALDGGGQELLAVGNYSAAADDATGTHEAGAGADTTVSGPLPLPYSLPD